MQPSAQRQCAEEDTAEADELDAAWMLDSICQVNMSKIANIERQIEALTPEELSEFRAWFLEFDWAAWDRQLEANIQAGKLARLAQEARRDHAAGKTRPLTHHASPEFWPPYR